MTDPKLDELSRTGAALERMRRGYEEIDKEVEAKNPTDWRTEQEARFEISKRLNGGDHE